jgi:hypothetical protein
LQGQIRNWGGNSNNCNGTSDAKLFLVMRETLMVVAAVAFIVFHWCISTYSNNPNAVLTGRILPADLLIGSNHPTR